MSLETSESEFSVKVVCQYFQVSGKKDLDDDDEYFQECCILPTLQRGKSTRDQILTRFSTNSQDSGRPFQ